MLEEVMMELPLPKEAKAALSLAPELMTRLERIANLLEELVTIERARDS